MFVVVGACLLLANIWYVRNLRRALSTHRIPDVISPFQFIGIEDKESIKGRAMASMLAARISAKQNELRTAQEALKLSTLGVPAPNQTTEQRPTPLHFEARFVEVPDVKLQVSGVDLSGLFAWLVRGLNESRTIQVTVHCPSDSTHFTATADLATQNIPNIWLDQLEKNDAKVIDKMAMEILWLHVVQSESFPEAAGLTREEFENLVSVMVNVADLNQRIIRHANPKPVELQTILENIDKVLQRTPEWFVLLKLAAQTAERSENINNAIAYYRRAAATLPQESAERETIEKRIELLAKVLVPDVSPALATTAAVTLEPLVREWPQSSLAIPINRENVHRKVRVAIAGGRPTTEQLHALKMPSEPAGSANSVFAEHSGNIALLIQSIAPATEFVFADMDAHAGSASSADILLNMEKLLQENPDIVVIGWRIPASDKAPMSAFLTRCRDANILPVLAAGNMDMMSQTIEGANINPVFADLAMVVGAITPNGLVSAYSLGKDSPGLFWAPGDFIPVPVSRDGSIGTINMNGTSFSAALAAGVVARLLEQIDDAVSVPIADVEKALRESSAKLNPDGPPVLQFLPALHRLKP